jgi:hypothetical protein
MFGDVCEASKKAVRLVTDGYLICTGTRELKYFVGQRRCNGPMSSQIAFLVRWVTDVDGAGVCAVPHHDEALSLIEREFEILGECPQ